MKFENKSVTFGVDADIIYTGPQYSHSGEAPMTSINAMAVESDVRGLVAAISRY